ncbi:unnamed protein product [Closterium sp. NIES-54]
MCQPPTLPRSFPFPPFPCLSPHQGMPYLQDLQAAEGVEAIIRKEAVPAKRLPWPCRPLAPASPTRPLPPTRHAVPTEPAGSRGRGGYYPEGGGSLGHHCHHCSLPSSLPHTSSFLPPHSLPPPPK